jgi:hypothetical protein
LYQLIIGLFNLLHQKGKKNMSLIENQSTDWHTPDASLNGTSCHTIRSEMMYQAPTMTKTELELRRLLAIHATGSSLYCDDGELQDCTKYPFIDFLRDSPELIRLKIQQRNLNLLNKPG